MRNSTLKMIKDLKMKKDLKKMKERKKAKDKLKTHSVAQKALGMKMNYLNGIALMIAVDEESPELEKKHLTALVKALDFDNPALVIKELVRFAENTDSKVFESLMKEIKKDKLIKELFMVDAILMVKKNGEIHEDEAEILKDYFERLSFSSEEEKKIRNIADIIDAKDEDEALSFYLADQKFYNKFFYFFDFLGIDSKKKRDEIFDFEWVRWEFTSGGVVDDNLVSKNPVTNRQYARFLNSIMKENVIKKGEEEVHLFVDLADSDLSFNEEKQQFVFEEKDVNQFITGVKTSGITAFSNWIRDHVDKTVTVLDLYSTGDGFNSLSGDIIYEWITVKNGKAIGITKYNECFSKSDSKLDTGYMPWRFSSVDEVDKFYVITPGTGIHSDDIHDTFPSALIYGSYGIKNTVFRLMKSNNVKK